MEKYSPSNGFLVGCRETKEILLVEGPDQFFATLISETYQNKGKETTIYSDCLRAYNARQGNGYQHVTVNDPKIHAHT